MARRSNAVCLGAHALIAGLVSTGCNASHGVDSGVPRDGGRHLDAPQHDGGTDAGTDANVVWDLAISVTDGDGGPLGGAAWVVVGSDGSRHEGLSDALGQNRAGGLARRRALQCECRRKR